MLPKISIIIPLYNVEEYILECLQSVEQQTYSGDVECIIVDDCGTDSSLAITEQFIANYGGTIDFKVVHHTHNRGLSAARNTGVEHAKGDYIYFLDSDDYISDDCIEVLTEPLNNKDYDMVVGDYKAFPNQIIITIMDENLHQSTSKEEIFYHYYIRRSLYVMAWNKLTKASLFKENDLIFLEGQLHEDDLWTYKTMRCVNTIAIQHKCTYLYRIRENSIAHIRSTNIEKRCWSFYETACYVIQNRMTDNLDYHNTCAIHYFNHFLEYVKDDFVINYTRYKHLREIFVYHPLYLFLKGKITLMDLKHQFHLLLPTSLGWIYLQIKRLKNKNYD